MIEPWRSTRDASMRPSAASSASRAEVAEPQGERSTSPSAKTVTLRWRGPSARVAEVLEEDRPVDAGQARVGRMARVLARVEQPLDLASERDQLAERFRVDG